MNINLVAPVYVIDESVREPVDTLVVIDRIGSKRRGKLDLKKTKLKPKERLSLIMYVGKKDDSDLRRQRDCSHWRIQAKVW